jgi:TonB family protein
MWPVNKTTSWIGACTHLHFVLTASAVTFVAACSRPEPVSVPVATAADTSAPGPASASASAAGPVNNDAASATLGEATGRAQVVVDPFAGVDAASDPVLRQITRIDEAAVKTVPRRPPPVPIDGATGTEAATAARPVTTAAAAPAVEASTASAPARASAGAPEVAPVVGPAGPPAELARSVEPPAPVAAPPPLVVATAAAPTPARRRALEQPRPEFPREAVIEGVTEGRVLATLQVAADGRVTDVTIVSATPSRVFVRSAQRALRSWRYEAAPQASTVQVELVFRTE